MSYLFLSLFVSILYLIVFACLFNIFNYMATHVVQWFLRHNINTCSNAASLCQYVAETRETKLNNEKQRKNECIPQ